MDTTNQWWAFVTDLLAGDTPADAERKSGIGRSNFTRWKQGRDVEPEMAVALTRKYGGNVLEALVACGLITQEEARLRRFGLKAALETATDHQLVMAVLRRVGGRDEAGEPTELRTPLDEVDTSGDEDFRRVPPSPLGKVAQVGDVEAEQEGAQETP